MKKTIQIEYNPYDNKIKFLEKEENNWKEFDYKSDLMKYQNKKCIFQNCAEDIIKTITKYIIINEGTIEFIGTDEDFKVLKKEIEESGKKIKCEHKGKYNSADNALSIIKKSYDKISAEFQKYLPQEISIEDKKNNDKKEIGELIDKFNDTVKPDIPICVIGTYSSGKSAFINALVGEEILPSQANAETARNVIVRQANEYKLKFKYMNRDVTITYNDYKCVANYDDGELCDKLEKRLNREIGNENLSVVEAIRLILKYFDKKEVSGDDLLENISSDIYLYMPFRKSSLDFNKVTYSIYDTPGSNNGDINQLQHRENLERILREQTNALPIWLVKRDAIASNDNNDIDNLLRSNEKGFSKLNCLMVISQADRLSDIERSEELPSMIKNYCEYPAVFYVSAVVALGAKKKDDEAWIDKSYEEAYKKYKKLGGEDLTTYNKMLKRYDNPIELDKSSELYMSGILSVEKAINYFVKNFADYKKCVNGKEYLEKAMEKADELLNSQKQKKKYKQGKKKEEQELKRQELLNKIENVKIPVVNNIITDTRKKYNGILENYCKTIPSEMKKIWKSVKDKDKACSLLKDMMTNHCQKNLYDKNTEDIQIDIKLKLNDLAKNYTQKLKNTIDNNNQDLSKDCKQEIANLFNDMNNDTPQFKDKSRAAFKGIGTGIFIKILRMSDDKWCEKRASIFCEKLKGGPLSIGIFARQCIKEPIEEYKKQLEAWKEQYKNKIKQSLDKESAIMSKYNAEIESLSRDIDDLERRLGNLKDVKQALESVLEVQKND